MSQSPARGIEVAEPSSPVPFGTRPKSLLFMTLLLLGEGDRRGGKWHPVRRRAAIFMRPVRGSVITNDAQRLHSHLTLTGNDPASAVLDIGYPPMDGFIDRSRLNRPPPLPLRG